MVLVKYGMTNHSNVGGYKPPDSGPQSVSIKDMYLCYKRQYTKTAEVLVATNIYLNLMEGSFLLERDWYKIPKKSSDEI